MHSFIRGGGGAVVLNVQSRAEEITITTYYPSPYGVYRTLRLYPGSKPATCQQGELYYDDGSSLLTPAGLYYCDSSSAWQSIAGAGGYWKPAAPLAPNDISNDIYNTNSGNVGIGTSAPAQKLEVVGTAQSDSLLLNPQTSVPAAPLEGMLYFNDGENTPYIYSDGDWRKIIFFLNEVVGERTLASNDQLCDGCGYELIGGRDAGGVELRITDITPQRGLYQVSWGGTLDIDADASRDFTAIIRITQGNNTIYTSEAFEDDDGIRNNVSTPHDISGTTMLMLNKGINHSIRMLGKKTGGFNRNLSKVLAGAWIKLELILPM